ncbi:RbsD/FucU family protein [Georgenia sp.]
MLMGIDPLISPELLYTLARMGHGDQLVIADRNFPAYATHERVHRLDGVDAAGAARAVLSLFPLDTFVENPVEYMAPDGEGGAVHDVHIEFRTTVREVAGWPARMGPLERAQFYPRAREAFAVLVTGECRPYGCFIVTKGVLPAVDRKG